ncbi:formate/nitrite transporter family protein [Mobilitalea sibirica]|uniref:Formate/nitrite transporter family protein n=1 Tax=Mobilitalea sibirica TaxID=1462919 RepID=A0A8J7KWW4_9FIRM|nr:formate/nitrite transporter family protein [Mobilitalea sibirica]MBH1941830.1 formate/nitrite transporter family protein [Mobilitalea sibirica]
MFKTFIRATMAGVAVSIGGAVYLSVENQIIGAFLFTIGLFTIYTFGFDLYTGKVCYIPNKKLSYLNTVFTVFLGNALGTIGTGYLFRQTKLIKLSKHSAEIVNNKLSDGLFSAFIMGFFCGILMCVAVMGYLTIKDSLGKYLAMFLPIMVFVLIGFEHSIANMFYYSIADMWTIKSFAYLIIIAFGNMMGGASIPFAKKIMDKEAIGCN